MVYESRVGKNTVGHLFYLSANVNVFPKAHLIRFCPDQILHIASTGTSHIFLERLLFLVDCTKNRLFGSNHDNSSLSPATKVLVNIFCICSFLKASHSLKESQPSLSNNLVCYLSSGGKSLFLTTPRNPENFERQILNGKICIRDLKELLAGVIADIL